MGLVKRSRIDFTRVFDLLAYQRDRYPNSRAINSRKKDDWTACSIYQLQDQVDNVSAWLLKAGLKKGDRMVFVPRAGSIDWLTLDFACQQVGIIPVLLYPTLHKIEVLRILIEVEPKYCICADQVLYELYRSVVLDATLPFQVFHLEKKLDGYFIGLNQQTLLETQLNMIHHIANEILESDTLCILYTSGSTGESKGVVLSHANVVFNIKAIIALLPIESHYRVISFLPFAHIFERVTCYAYLAFGVAIYFSEDKNQFTRDFKSVRPHCCTAVPRVLEKMYEFIENKSESSGRIKRKIIQWAMRIGQQYDDQRKATLLYGIQLFIAKQLVLYRWRRALGNHIRFMIVGAAALRPEIGRLFTAGGIRIIEGYGLTEMAPLIAINRFEPGQQRWGTVGMVIPGIDIHLEKLQDNEAGEIWVRGPNLMQGYFKKPELTASVIRDDGWFQTGDIGRLVDGIFLQITDRKKDLFKTSSGKYIAPMPLQQHFTRSPFIDRCMILGFQRPFVTALIVPNFEILESWCDQHAIHYTSPEYMVHNIKVKAWYNQEVSRLNEQLPSHERVRAFVLCPQDWTIENGALTPTLKPIRHLLMVQYQKEIEQMYG